MTDATVVVNSLTIKKLSMYKLAKNMVETCIDENIKKYINNYEVNDDYINILFNHNLALQEFKYKQDEFLTMCRKYYKKHLTEFVSLDFAPKKINAKIKEEKIKREIGYMCNDVAHNPNMKSWDKKFRNGVNKTENPELYKAFETLRECVK